MQASDWPYGSSSGRAGVVREVCAWNQMRRNCRQNTLHMCPGRARPAPDGRCPFVSMRAGRATKPNFGLKTVGAPKALIESVEKDLLQRMEKFRRSRSLVKLRRAAGNCQRLSLRSCPRFRLDRFRCDQPMTSAMPRSLGVNTLGGLIELQRLIYFPNSKCRPSPTLADRPAWPQLASALRSTDRRTAPR
jgi:hypothetical protein